MNDALNQNDRDEPQSSVWRRILKPFRYVITGLFALVVIAMGDDPSQELSNQKSRDQRKR
ncbi:MAG: hypothetical protein OXH19_04165 [Chloroflexi bacterium]|nr:hypothetical protein [Chloroflexota bacterium]MCY3588470.1 hypothetical protein [Chloroflexota bacterium]MCY3686813.1 hypothetical protein [Chloroflexota bacterium]MDE2709395.1 hypothetical protein [Chloroflexota bacterium]